MELADFIEGLDNPLTGKNLAQAVNDSLDTDIGSLGSVATVAEPLILISEPPEGGWITDEEMKKARKALAQARSEGNQVHAFAAILRIATLLYTVSFDYEIS